MLAGEDETGIYFRVLRSVLAVHRLYHTQGGGDGRAGGGVKSAVLCLSPQEYVDIKRVASARAWVCHEGLRANFANNQIQIQY